MTGATGWCLFGRHDRCSYRPGGICQGGIKLRDGSTYTCPCECHRDQAEQLALEVAV